MSLLYVSERVGKNGQPVEIYKFRTMYEGADKDYDNVVAKNGHNGHKINNDPRVTSFGRFLRKFWLDEIPQLWNWIKGDIDLVGPRVKIRKAWEMHSPEHRERMLKLEQGLIGVKYAGDTSSLTSIEETERKYADLAERDKRAADVRYGVLVFLNLFKRGFQSR